MAPMSADRWRMELKAAVTDKDVLNVARDYVAFLASEELKILPRDLRPGPIAGCEQIAEWALKLVQASLSLDPEASGIALLHEISEFFAAASARLTELQGRRHRQRS